MLRHASQFRHEARIVHETGVVEVVCEQVAGTKKEIGEKTRPEGSYLNQQRALGASVVPVGLLGRIVVHHLKPTQKLIPAKTPAKNG